MLDSTNANLLLELKTMLIGMDERLGRLESKVSVSVVKEGYTTKDVAERVGRAEFTVRQWCNNGQVDAKKVIGNGRTGEWRISHDELCRIQANGVSDRRTFDNR